MMKILTALESSGLILLQISEDEKALAHVKLTSKDAVALANDLLKLAGMVKK